MRQTCNLQVVGAIPTGGLFLLKMEEKLRDLKLKKRKKKQLDELEIDPYSDFPVHEKYTKEEPVKR